MIDNYREISTSVQKRVFLCKGRLKQITTGAISISLGNSIICSGILHKYHEWYFEIVIRNFTSRQGSEILDNFEISRVVFMQNITYKSCCYLFILLPAKVCNFHMQVFQIKLKNHCSNPMKLQKFLMLQYNNLK